MQLDYSVDWSILKVETNYFQRLTAKACFIKWYPYVIKSSDGDGQPHVYRPLAV